MKRDNQTDCSSVKARILQGEKLNVEEELHLLGCSDCQAFAQAQQLLLEPQRAPSAELDSRVLASVKAQRKPLPVRKRAWVRHSIAAAASIVIVCCLTFMLMTRKGGQTQAEDSLQAVIPSMALEYALADNELGRMEVVLDALNLGAEASTESVENGVEGVRRLDYDIISLEMDMFYDL